MLTPTLFDVVAITCLRPDVDSLNPDEQNEYNIEFDSNYAGSTKYIEDYRVTETTKVTA